MGIEGDVGLLYLGIEQGVMPEVVHKAQAVVSHHALATLRVEDEKGGQTSAAGFEYPRNLLEVVGGVGGHHVGEDRKKEGHIKAVVGVREDELMRFGCCAEVVEVVFQVDVCEPEIGVPTADVFVAPVYTIFYDVDALVFAQGAEVLGEGRGSAADARTDVEHLMVGLQTRERDKLLQHGSPLCFEVARAHEYFATGRGHGVAFAGPAFHQI